MRGNGVRAVLCFAWVLGGCSRILGLEPPEPWLESDASAGGGTSGSAGEAGASGEAGSAGQAGGAGGTGGTGGEDGGSEEGGDAGCKASEKWCGSCVALDDPAFGCTAQGCAPCELDHATAECDGTSCVVLECDSVWGDCDGKPENGCEESMALGFARRCVGKRAESCYPNGPWAGEECGIGCEDGECLRALDLAAGGNHTCSILSNGEMWCWGDNGKGQLGIGSATPSSSASPKLVQGLTGARQVSLGMGSTCAVNAANELRCWGDNSAGQLGTGGNVPLLAPPVAATLHDVLRVEAGTFNSVCVVGTDFRIWCFGAPMASFQPGGNPTEVQGVLGPHLAVGTGFACAGSEAGLKCWGDDGAGQLGDGVPLQNSSEPVSVSVSAPWGGAGAGDAASYSFTTDGKVYAWGGNGSGQLGTGVAQGESSPRWVPLPASVIKIDGVDGGFRHACVAGADDENQRVVYCVGSNDHGELGQGSLDGSSGVPVPVMAAPGTTLRSSRIAVGWQHNCAVVSDGTEIVCWGLNAKGQLGDGYLESRGFPVRVVFP